MDKKDPATNRALIKNKSDLIMTIQAPSSTSQLALTLEQFVSKAEAFLQNHYTVGSEATDVQQILKAIADLRLDIDNKALEAEFELVQEKQDLMGDYYDSAYF
jgi:hypothetical protein